MLSQEGWSEAKIEAEINSLLPDEGDLRNYLLIDRKVKEKDLEAEIKQVKETTTTITKKPLYFF